MPGVAVETLDFAGGRQLGGGGAGFRVVGRVVVVIGDPVLPHGSGAHGGMPVMVTGQARFRINGIPICREGDLASCGHPTTGRPKFRVS
jgi:uncharacterized Zn-binding protein involved in type VI secretion